MSNSKDTCIYINGIVKIFDKDLENFIVLQLTEFRSIFMLFDTLCADFLFVILRFAIPGQYVKDTTQYNGIRCCFLLIH